MAADLKIKRNNAIALFLALGLKKTAALTNDKLQAKLLKLGELPDIETTVIDDDMVTTKVPEQYKGSLTGAKLTKGKDTVLAAIKSGRPIVVEDDAPAAAPAGEAAKPDEVVNVKPNAAEKKAAAEKAKAEAAAAKEAAKKKAAEEKAAAKAAAKTPSLPGVRETVTRPFVAGQIIKRHGGLAAGVTDAMVAELDKEYGKVNPTESMFCMRNAWHAIRGFMGTSVGAAKDAKPAAAKAAPAAAPAGDDDFE